MSIHTAERPQKVVLSRFGDVSNMIESPSIKLVIRYAAIGALICVGLCGLSLIALFVYIIGKIL